MPLTKSASPEAFKSNLKAELASGRPKDQALAIAFRVQRDARKKKKMSGGGRVKGYAMGGTANVGPHAPPFYAKDAARQTGRPSGIINSAVPGRSDKIGMGVQGGSYVMPADVISAIGQGNSIAGARGMDRMLKSGPYGMGAAKPPSAGRRPGKFADGGEVDAEEPEAQEPVDIMAAGGEYVIAPEQVAAIGGGDLKRGHDILDNMVAQIRKKAIKTLKNLPGPRQR